MSQCQDWSGFEQPTNLTCADGFEIQPVYSTWQEILVSCCAGLCLLAVFSVGYIIISCRKKRMVRHSFVYLLAMLIGYVNLLLAVYLWPQQTTTGLCFSKPWVIAIGYGLIAGALLSKVYRAYYMFVLANHPDKTLSEILEYNSRENVARFNQRLRWFFAAIVVLELLICTLMLSIPVARPVVKYSCFCPNKEVIYTTCKFYDEFGWIALAINLIPLTFGVYWGCWIFKVNKKMQKKAALELEKGEGGTAVTLKMALKNEIRQLVPIIYCIITLAVVGIIMVVLHDLHVLQINVGAFYLIRSFMFMFAVMTTLVFIFMPVLTRLRAKNSDDSGKSFSDTQSPLEYSSAKQSESSQHEENNYKADVAII